MTQSQGPKVLEFRMQRLRKAPRNWTYWVAGFTAANGLFLILQHDVMILAGLALPFVVPGPFPHLMVAILFGAIAYVSNKIPKILIISFIIYLGDTVFTAYVQLWSGLVLHLVVLAFVGLSFLGARALKNLMVRQNGAET